MQTLSHLSDTELITRCQTRHDHLAFSELVNRYRNEIYRIVYYYVRNAEDALDVMQEAFIKAYISLATLDDTSRFRVWLIRIAVNQAIDNYRKWSKQTANNCNQNADETGGLRTHNLSRNPRNQMETKELNQQITYAISKLPKQQQLVFILRFIYEMPISEIAESVSCSEGSVKSNVFHALRKMRKELAKLQKGELPYAPMSLVSNPGSGIPVWGIDAEQIAEVQ
ncbi:MAG: sigma-70 family RNA polymerase sigma factor [bacterium]|nr:sigma-70 family RNA polymerase sigma factor [bacterium]